MSTTPILKRTTLTAEATPRGIIDAFRTLPSEIPADADIVKVEDFDSDAISFARLPDRYLDFTIEWLA